MSRNSDQLANAESGGTRPMARRARWRLARHLLAPMALVGVLACVEDEASSTLGPLKLSILPGETATTIQALEGNASIQHPLDVTVAFVWSWKLDGADTGFTTQKIATSDTIKHQTWQVTVFADFGSSTSESLTAQFLVVNSPPTFSPDMDPGKDVPIIEWPADSGVCVTGPRIDDACTTALSDCGGKFFKCAPRAGNTLSAPVMPRDDDNDTVSLAYQWAVNDVDVATTFTLAPSFFSADDIVGVTVTPNDGELGGQSKTSVEVTVQPAVTSLQSSEGVVTTTTVSSASTSGDVLAADTSRSISTPAEYASRSSVRSRAKYAPGSPIAVPAVITSGSQVTVSISETSVCSIAADGRLECSGAEEFGLTNPPAGSYSQVAVEIDYACAIRADDRSIRCWGQPPKELGLLSPPKGPFIQIGLGIEAACGLRETGEIACWGDDSSGRASPPDGSFSNLDVSDAYSCAISVDGRVSCWGLVEKDALD